MFFRHVFAHQNPEMLQMASDDNFIKNTPFKCKVKLCLDTGIRFVNVHGAELHTE